MATAQVSGDQKVYQMMCNRLRIKATKFQQSSANRFWAVAKQLPGGQICPLPPYRLGLNSLTYQPHSNFQQGAAMFTASWIQLQLELLVCDRSVSVNIITNTFVGLKCLTETKIQILYDLVDYTRFHIVEMGCQMV